MSSTHPIEQYLLDLDRAWGGAEPRIRLRMLGSAALMLQAAYLRGTKDADVLGVEPVRDEIKEKLLRLAGKGSGLHVDHRFYLDVVPSGLPFLPHPPRFLPLETLNGRLAAFHIEVLDAVDVVVSKLKRFNGEDLMDIRAMVDLERVEQEPLLERFRTAVDRFAMDARADDLPAIIQNLHFIERECFSAKPTPIALPPWMDEG